MPLPLALACILAFLIRDLVSMGYSSSSFTSQIASGMGTVGYQAADPGQQPLKEGFGYGRNPLAIPTGKAEALPSIRIDDTDATYEREIYGGKGDKPHLGGFTELDPDGLSPAVWKWMIETLGVKSLLDVSYLLGGRCLPRCPWPSISPHLTLLMDLAGWLWSRDIHYMVSIARGERDLCGRKS